MRIQRRSIAIGSIAILLALNFIDAGRAENAPKQIFTVSDEAPTLCEIGLLLYGRCSAYRKVARWNDLQAPYQVRSGQVLVLREPATLSLEDGRAKLLSIWRKKFGLAVPKSMTAAGVPAKVERAKPESPKSAYEAALESAKKKVVIAIPVKASPVQSPPVASVALSKPAEEPAPQPRPEIGNVELQLPPKEAEKETRILAAEEALEIAKALFEKNDYEAALGSFRSLRARQPKFLPSWIYEVRSLKALQREEDAEKTVSELLVANPELRPALQRMPLLAPYIRGAR